MTLKLYNTYSRQVEPLVPSNPDGVVRMYCCGPTVYNYAHIGNLRTYIFEDVLRKTIKRAGFPLKHAMNITDVGHLTSDADEGDDKMVLAAEKEHKTVMDIARKYEDTFFKHTQALNIDRPDIVCRATEHVQDMIKFVEELERKGYAYFSNGNVYFDTSKFPAYGSLSGQKRDDLKHGARVETDENKRNESDFVLWFTSSKFKNQILQWDTKWGRGYPGWHIECSAMSHRYLKDMFDIHGGGLDLRFPHHENEMAQTRAAGYDSAARWMHSAWVTAKGEKMSKSLGNGLSVPAVLAEHSAWVVRYALGSVQYRSMLEWSDQTLAEAQSAYDRVANFIERAGAAVGEQPSREEIMAISADALPADFVAAMNDDINVSGASAAIFTAIRSGNTLLSKLADRADSDVAKAEVREALVNVRAMLDTLGLDPLAEPWVSDGAAGGAAGAGADSAEHDALDKLVSEQLAERAEARKAKDFARADAIRDALGAAGIAIEDGPQGSTWSLK